MRINQYVAAATGLSRRGADAAITAGRVQVNSQPATLGRQVATSDHVTLDGQPLTLAATHTYIALHKPAGYVTSRTRQGSDPTLYELLPAQFARLRSAGRLDRDSSGLILLSDDGQFIYQLTHPSFDKAKVYELNLERSLKPADRLALEQGVKLTDGPSRVQVEAVQGRRLTVSLHEGRNRQLRRTLGALGYGITRLHRLSIGPYQLGDLATGAWRPVEVAA